MIFKHKPDNKLFSFRRAVPFGPFLRQGGRGGDGRSLARRQRRRVQRDQVAGGAAFRRRARQNGPERPLAPLELNAGPGRQLVRPDDFSLLPLPLLLPFELGNQGTNLVLFVQSRWVKGALAVEAAPVLVYSPVFNQLGQKIRVAVCLQGMNLKLEIQKQL